MAYPVEEGDVLAGKYQVESVLGKGGMGVVVAATHLQLKERVALKFLLPQSASEPEFAARFQREAQLMAKLRSEHVVRVSDVGVLDTGAPYMVMELLEGADLRDVIREVGQLPLDVALDYFLQACEGVAEAHALGIVHRDLKPTNLFVSQRRDGSSLVKVLDFGISKFHGDDVEDDDQLTGAATVLGSPKYMPPEQLRSSRDADHRADVWALGAILQELLTSAPPFSGTTTTALCAAIIGDTPTPIRQRRPDLPESLERVMFRCFEKDRDQRWQSVAELASEVVLATCPEDPAALLSVERIARLLAPVSLGGGRAGVLARSGASPLLNQTGTNPSMNRSGSYATSRRAENTPSSGRLQVARTSSPNHDEISVSAPGHSGSTPPPSQRGSNRGVMLAIIGAVVGLGGIAFAVFRPGAAPPAEPVTAGTPPSAGVPAASTAPMASEAPPTGKAPPATSEAPAASQPSPAASEAPTARNDDKKKKGAPVAKGPAVAPPAPSPTTPPAKEKPVANPLEDRH
jgi:serine/threonine protein kinase